MTAYDEPPTWADDVPLDTTNLNKGTDSIKYCKEVLDGTHTTKIKGAAMDADTVIMLRVFT